MCKKKYTKEKVEQPMFGCQSFPKLTTQVIGIPEQVIDYKLKFKFDDYVYIILKFAWGTQTRMVDIVDMKGKITIVKPSEEVFSTETDWQEGHVVFDS